MAACIPSDEDSLESENISALTKFQPLNSGWKNFLNSKNTQESIKLEGEKAYNTVATLEENDLRSLLEELTSQKKIRHDKSAIAQILLRTEEDAIREESGSGEDNLDIAFRRQKKKRLTRGREHIQQISSRVSLPVASAAARNSTGGSLGSLHDLTDPKHSAEPSNSNSQGVGSRSRAGGSCGNLSRGSFKTLPPHRQKGRRAKPINGASSRQREGGSLQNLNKAEAATGEPKYLHKSGSLSQVFSDVVGVRSKVRRHKTSSESSNIRSWKKSEDKDAAESSEEEGIASGETTEEEVEQLFTTAREKLGDCTRHNQCNAVSDTELCTFVNQSSNMDCMLPTISSDSEVDKPIHFNLLTQNPNGKLGSKPSGGLIEEKFHSKDGIDKQKLRSTKSDCSSEKSLDENGNPVSFFSRNCVGSTSNVSIGLSTLSTRASGCTDCSISQVTKKNEYNNSNKDISHYDRIKKKLDKKKAIKEKDVKSSENTPGYRGDATLDQILKFLGAGEENASSKLKKKHKNKEEPLKKTKNKSNDKSYEEMSSDKVKDDGRKMHKSKTDENFSPIANVDDKKWNNKKLKDHERKKNRHSPNILRESSSVEDLISKSKQRETVKSERKQVTLDDGGVAFAVLSPYQYGKDSFVLAQNSENKISEFSYDFYKTGDIMDDESMISQQTGFEVVNRKKGKRNKSTNLIVSQTPKASGNSNNGSINNSKNIFNPPSTYQKTQRKTSGQGKPNINFSEGPRTQHDGMFFKHWPNSKNNGERISTTTSAPHSEASDSDGGDSVHSMPAHVITPKPDVHKPPPSTDSTPQTSYANIAKLAATTNRAQMKKIANVGLNSLSNENKTTSSPIKSDSVSPPKKNEKNTNMNKKAGNFLDDNFPPLSANDSKNDSLSFNFSTKSIESEGIVDETKKNLQNVNSFEGENPSISDHCIADELSSTVPSSIPQLQSPTSPLSNYITPTSLCSPREHSNTLTNNLNNNLDSNSVSNRKTADLPQFISQHEPNPVTLITQVKKQTTCKCSLNSNLKTKDNNNTSNQSVNKSKVDAAVIFTDNTKFTQSLTGYEFGFDLHLNSIDDLSSDAFTKSEVTSEVSNSNGEAVTSNSNCTDVIVKETKVDFRKLFKPPKNDVVSYNYEELCLHIAKSWESTLIMLDEEPKNIQYWKPNVPLKDC